MLIFMPVYAPAFSHLVSSCDFAWEEFLKHFSWFLALFWLISNRCFVTKFE